MVIKDGKKIYVPATLAEEEEQAYIDEHYRDIETKTVRLTTIEGTQVAITVPKEARDSSTYSEIYRNNYKQYMK